MQKGISGSAGYGIGKIIMISNEIPVYKDRKIIDTEAEIIRFEEAVEAFKTKTMAMAENIKASVGEHNAEILEGHAEMISDPFFQDEIKGKVREGSCAEKALDDVCEMFITMFTQTEDDLTIQRATDISDIRVRMLKILTGVPDINISQVPKGTILVARDLTPSMTAGIVRENVEGILTEVGGKTSHSAILARALEIPAVLSVDHIVSMVHDGMSAVIDGSEGTVILEPDEMVVKEYQEKKRQYLEGKKKLEMFRGKDTETGDGIRVFVYGNIGTPEDAKRVLEQDGEGIGLFRTEFLFMGKTKLPEEEEQFVAYKQVAELMQGREVIIRTLDVGGDKEIPYLDMEKEDNPFLGYRAVRFCLKREDIYRVQLRALLRASAYGNIKIMIPLVTCVEEIREVKRLVEQLKRELDKEEIPYDKEIQIGVMIETPAASEIADVLAKEADFFSIGTNDLIQYTMAVDRGNAKVAYLYSAYQPAVLRSIRRIIGAANDAGIMAGMCGEAAADPLLTPLFISFGLKEYSVSPNAILSSRSSIAKWTRKEADKITEEVMKCATEAEVMKCLTNYSIKSSCPGL